MTPSSLVFATPWWLLALLPLPWLGWRLLRAYRQRRASVMLRHPVIEQWGATDPAAVPVRAPRPWVPWLQISGLALLVLALAQPQWLGAWIQPPPPARSILLLVDASPSMMAQDFPADSVSGKSGDITRMDAMKQALNRFVAARPQDRFSVIVVTDVASTLLPMTADHQALQFWINQLQPGLNGSATALGDGLALAIRRMGQAVHAGKKPPLLVIWTDGFNTGGLMTPGEALALARERGIHVYTVNLAPKGAPPEPGQPTLAQIASLSGGAPIAAGNLKELNAVTNRIAQREAGPPTQPTERTHHPLYMWPALLGVLMLLLAGFLARRDSQGGGSE